MMVNTPIEGHPLIGTTHTFRPDQPPYDAAADTTPGAVVIGCGHQAQVLSVFKNWNDVDGLDMLYVLCPETGNYTHVTPADLALPPLD